jgi:hypothetical protein
VNRTGVIFAQGHLSFILSPRPVTRRQSNTKIEAQAPTATKSASHKWRRLSESRGIPILTLKVSLNAANRFRVWEDLGVRPVGRREAAEIRASQLKNKKEVIDMPLLQVVIVLIVVGVLLWLVNRFIPMQSTIKSILNAVVVIAVVIWLLNLFGLFQAFSNIHVGK